MKLMRPLPSKFKVTRNYGNDNNNKFHKGVQIQCPIGTYVVSAQVGEVVSIYDLAEIGESAKYNGGYGNSITIKHIDTDGNVLYTRYSHLKDVMVKVGQKVGIGRAIATTGIASHNEEPYLDFEVRTINNDFAKPTRDPLDYVEIPFKLTFVN